MNLNPWWLLRVWWLSSQLRARHAPAPVLVRYHHPLEGLFVHALRASPGNKVWVHWGAFESGKSTAAQNAAASLTASRRSVLLLHGYHTPWGMPLREWLVEHQLGLSDGHTASHFMDAVVVDHCDYLFHGKGHGTEEAELVAAARALGVNVLLIVSSWERALALRQHGAELVGEPGCGRWTPEQLERAVVATIESEVVETEFRDDVHQKERLRICKLAQTPSGLLDRLAVRTRFYEEQRARLIVQEWENGIRALTTGDASFAEGRFPDKDGHFHWD